MLCSSLQCQFSSATFHAVATPQDSESSSALIAAGCLERVSALLGESADKVRAARLRCPAS